MTLSDFDVFDLVSLGNYEEPLLRAIQAAGEISDRRTQQIVRILLATIYLSRNNLVNARATIEAALQYDVPEYNHNASALHGIILLRDLTGFTESLTGGATRGENLSGLAVQAFTRAIAQADEILAKTPEYYSALDAKGLALCGLAICRGGSRTARTEIDDAIETFRKARKIAPHAGVVKSVLKLFDELVKCDKEGMLAEVRKAAEGNDIQT